MIKLYTPASHRFFDALITFIAGLSLQNLGAALQRREQTKPFAPGDNLILHGKPNVSGIQISLRPHPVLDSILTGNWPTQIEIDEHPLDSRIPTRFAKMPGMSRLNGIQLGQAYATYVENTRTLVATKHGNDSSCWPSVWNFGRVLRNAVSHGGAIKIDNPLATPVLWKSLSYGPAENGRLVLFQDMAFVDVFALMEEMDRSV